MVMPFPLRTRTPRFAKILLAASLLIASANASASSIFINEIHYDNAGADTGEAIEIAGHAGLDLTGWKLVRYNGGDGTFYGTEDLHGTLPDQQDGFGTLVFGFNMQNGSPDGIALVDFADTVIQFLSYEGVFSASDGPASGMGSADIGVAEAGDTPVGYSLQLTGAGNLPGDFTWAQAQPDTFGSVNTGQTFVPVPAALPLFLSGIAGVGFFCRGGRKA